MTAPNTPRIVLLVQQPLSPRDLARFGISAMLARGYAVSVFDVADLMFPMLPNVREHYRNFSGFGLFVIRTRAALRAAGKAIADAQLAVCYVGSGYVHTRAWPVLRLLSASSAPYLIAASSTPSFSASARDDRSSMNVMERLKNPLSLMDSFLARLPLRLLGLRPADFVVVPALESDLNRPLFAGKSRRIPAHVMDYDLYLEEMARPEKPQNVAVFIDQNMGFHPDLKSMGMNWFNPDTFYGHLRLFFDKVESDLGLEVVIAAHPRADYSRMPGLFGARRVVHGQTPSLIRNGRLVISAYSTATLQAVMHRKPVLFYTSPELMAHPYFSTVIRKQSRYFSATAVSIDRSDKINIASFVRDTTSMRESCLRNWVRHPDAAEKPYWDIVLDALAEAGALPPPDSRASPRAAPIATRAAL